MINTAVAESLRQYADYLEAAPDFIPALQELIRSTIIKHKRIIFNGNNYDPAWQSEAVGVRGLLNLKTTPDCMPCLLSKKNVELLVSHRVYSEPELRSRCEIILENYCKVINIEALTMIEMARKQILPAVEGYCADLANAAALKRAIVPDIELSYEKGLIQRLTRLINEISERTDALEAALCEIRKIETVEKQSCACRDLILTKMNELRAAADEAETIVAGGYWPYPTYGELLFGVR
jgi:glutamine synthetase